MSRIAIAVLLLCAQSVAAQAAAREPRAGLKPCRIGAQALIGYLDDGKEASGEYAHAYGMVDTCGPRRTKEAKAAAVRPVTDRAACRALALTMLDELDENRLHGRAFVRARDRFAAACGPAPGVEPRTPAAR